MQNQTLTQERASELPPMVRAPGILMIHCNRPALWQSLAELASRVGLLVEREAEALNIQVPARQLEKLVAEFACEFNGCELEKCRVMWCQAGTELDLRSWFNVTNLREFCARVRSEWFLELLESRRFETHFQPIVPVSSPFRAFAFEALLRGKVEDGELIWPNALFEVAGALELKHELDGAAREAAISQAKHLCSGNTKLFLNCLPSSLEDYRATLEALLSSLAMAQISPSQVVLEMVESECVESITELQSCLKCFREAGFGLALDDLGAGYSSLKLLSQLRPEFVKIDRELICGVDEDGWKALITRKLLETAHELGIRTVAEGVETAGEWRWLREHGGDFAQGYFFAHPSTQPITAMLNRDAYNYQSAL